MRSLRPSLLDPPGSWDVKSFVVPTELRSPGVRRQTPCDGGWGPIETISFLHIRDVCCQGSGGRRSEEPWRSLTLFSGPGEKGSFSVNVCRCVCFEHPIRVRSDTRGFSDELG